MARLMPETARRVAELADLCNNVLGNMPDLTDLARDPGLEAHEWGLLVAFGYCQQVYRAWNAEADQEATAAAVYAAEHGRRSGASV